MEKSKNVQNYNIMACQHASIDFFFFIVFNINLVLYHSWVLDLLLPHTTSICVCKYTLSKEMLSIV